MSFYYATPTFGASSASYITTIATALTNQGWTIVDNISSTHQIYRCPDVLGFSGIFFHIEFFFDGSLLEVNSYQDWDSSSHTGTPSGGSAGAGFLTTGGPGYVRANPYSCYFFVNDGAFNKNGLFGLQRSLQVVNYSDGLTLSTAGMLAGATSVTVQDNLVGRLFVGQKIAIMNFAHNSGSANWAHHETVTVTSVSAGSIGFSATANAYDSGAKLGSPDLLLAMGGSGSTFNTFNGNYIQISSAWSSLNMDVGGTIISVGPTGSFDGGTLTGLIKQSQVGFTVPTFMPIITNNQANQEGFFGLPSHLLFATPYYSGGIPATGHQYTDGTNVFTLMLGGTGPGGNQPSLLIGPTGDTPNLSTMTHVLPSFVAVSDTLYAVPPPPAPPSTGFTTNTFDQGFN